MAANLLSAPSPDDRRNISSLLNPSDNMDSSLNPGLPSPQVQLNPYAQQPQQMPQGQQHPGIPPIIHTGATHQSHLFPPLPPDHPMQAILVQSAAEPNSFRLTRASWGGDGPPPEGFEGSSQKRKLPDGTDEPEQRTLCQNGTPAPNRSTTPNGSSASTSNGSTFQVKKPKGRSKVARTKAAAAGLPPSQLQYPTEPYIPQTSSHCTQPSVGLGEAVATPIPLAPPQLPPATTPKIKWKKSKQQINGDGETSESASQFQSSERVSLRIAARGSMSSASSPSASASPDPSHAQLGPEGQPFEQQNTNGKRVLEDDSGASVNGKGKKKKKSGAVPINAPPHTLNGYGMPMHMPMHMNMNSGGAGEIPLDPAFFNGAGPSHGGGGGGMAYPNYPPPPSQDQSFFRDQSHHQPHPHQQPPPHFDPSQHAGPSQPPQQPPAQYPLDNGPPNPGKLIPELQFARCMSNRYKPDPFPRCVSCTRRWAGDTCRFQGIRFFLRDEERHVLGVSFVDSQTAESPNMKFPSAWNVPLESAQLRRVKFTVAKALLPTLRAEQDHLRLPEVIRRPRETEVRATCDTCMTSIFACSWMCRLCGREACEQCVRLVRDLTHPTRALTATGDKKLHSNPFFLSCTKRQEHALKDFSPVSRFCWDELEGVVREMEQLVKEENARAAGHMPVHESASWAGHEQAENLPSMSGSIMTTTETSSVRTSPDQNDPSLSLDPSLAGNSFEQPKPPGPPDPSIPPHTFMPTSVPLPPPVPGRFGDPLDPAQVPSLPYYVFDRAELSEAQFQPLWAVGQTVVVTGLLDSFSIRWTPEYFIQNFEQHKCLILECHTDENKSITVGEFFSQFGAYVGRTKCWKLKDWPPTSDFKTAFPELYEDFSRAVPIPNYTRRDGASNIASHFPLNTIAPDIGPKMYNAFASSEMPGAKGSTRLHMDMADAVNIMLYSSKRPDGGEGMAAWDIFRAEDTAKLRRFLRKRFKGQYNNDPIHSQMFYLDVAARRQLFEDAGVSSWRIYQRPGDAVFVPAGCAHQVVNLADCIKVACDFVSPENVDRCSMLTREFREQNQSQTWKEDVLQLSAMLWFCWLNLCRVEQGLVSQEYDSGAGPPQNLLS